MPNSVSQNVQEAMHLPKIFYGYIRVTLMTFYRTLCILLFGYQASLMAILCMYLTLGNTFGLCGTLRTIFSA